MKINEVETKLNQFQREDTSDPTPRWIAPLLKIAEGRDPLGFQTTTQDRLMPILLPGMLELTRRARYFSFHAFLLDEYQKKRLPVDIRSLSSFIKRCEWDLGLAIQRCPKHCGSSPVGTRRLGGIASGSGPFPRGESVESTLGGYGLYYRSPLASFGIVARAGTLLGEKPIPIDILYQTDRASQLAEGFRSAVSNTVYYKRWMWSEEPIPAEVIDEYSVACCLCRLPDLPDERNAVYDAIFGNDPHSSLQTEELSKINGGIEEIDSQVMQRRFSVGHYLTLVDAYPEIVNSESVFRERLWTPPISRDHNQEVVSGQWAALIAKDIWQEAVCSVWSEFCRSGRDKSRNLGRGLTWEETRQVAINMVDGPPKLKSERKTTELLETLEAGTFIFTGNDGDNFNISNTPFEELRSLIRRIDTATSGLILMLELARRANNRSGEGWQRALRIDSAWQPSVASVLMGLNTHLKGKPSIGESIWWILSKFILGIHERICYSKLPEFTFRFRWEDSLLRFYEYSNDRFPLAAIRNEPLASITKDLGFWITMPPNYTGGVLTEQGRKFVDEVFR